MTSSEVRPGCNVFNDFNSSKILINLSLTCLKHKLVIYMYNIFFFLNLTTQDILKTLPQSLHPDARPAAPPSPSGSHPSKIHRRFQQAVQSTFQLSVLKQCPGSDSNSGLDSVCIVRVSAVLQRHLLLHRRLRRVLTRERRVKCGPACPLLGAASFTSLPSGGPVTFQ